MHFSRLISAAFALQSPAARPKATTSRYSAASPSSDGENTDDRRYDELVPWLKSKGATISDKLELRASTRGGGFGCFLTESVEAEELLFTIPRSACVTLENALQDEDCGKTFSQIVDKAGQGGTTVVMAGYLAKEWLQTQHDLTDGKDLISTDFGPYLRTLPWTRGINNQEHILFWSNDDIESYLKGSMCYAEATALRQEVNLAIRVLNSVVRRPVQIYRGEVDPDAFQWPWEKKETDSTAVLEGFPEAMKGAFVCMLTRSFQDGEDEKLVPMLDMLQHSEDPSVSHVMRKVDGTVEVRARKDLEAGQELFNQYRSETEESMPYSRFFTRYGFVPGIQEDMVNLFKDKSSIFFAQKAEV